MSDTGTERAVGWAAVVLAVVVVPAVALWAAQLLLSPGSDRMRRHVAEAMAHEQLFVDAAKADGTTLVVRMAYRCPKTFDPHSRLAWEQSGFREVHCRSPEGNRKLELATPWLTAGGWFGFAVFLFVGWSLVARLRREGAFDEVGEAEGADETAPQGLSAKRVGFGILGAFLLVVAVFTVAVWVHAP